MWGSAQLINHPSILPSAVHDDITVKINSDDFYYFHCVQFIRQVRAPSKHGACVCAWGGGGGEPVCVC